MEHQPRLVNLNMRCHVCDKRFTLTDVYAVPQHNNDLVICPACCQEAQPRDFDLPMDDELPNLIDPKEAVRQARILEMQLEAVERANPEQVRQFIFNGKPLSLVIPNKRKEKKKKDTRHLIDVGNRHHNPLLQPSRLPLEYQQKESDVRKKMKNTRLCGTAWPYCFDCDAPIGQQEGQFGSCYDCMDMRYKKHRARTQRTREDRVLQALAESNEKEQRVFDKERQREQRRIYTIDEE